MRQSACCALFAVLACVVGPAAGCLAEGGGDGGLYVGSVTLVEDFETGSKTSYAAADVTLGTGTWNLNDALLGTTSSDVKNGAKAARVRNSGHITMGFDHASGAGTVTIRHARFGSDGNGTWGLFASQDHGATFTQVGATVTTTSSTFATATFAVNVAASIRFDIRKLDGGTNRINIDDVAISDPVATNPDFALTVSPSSVSSTAGAAATATVSVAALDGFSSAVSLSAAAAAGAPIGGAAPAASSPPGSSRGWSARPTPSRRCRKRRTWSSGGATRGSSGHRARRFRSAGSPLISTGYGEPLGTIPGSTRRTGRRTCATWGPSCRLEKRRSAPCWPRSPS